MSETTKTTIPGRIVEAGNGLANDGALVYCTDDNTVYRIAKSIGPIQTGAPGSGNYQHVLLEEAVKSDPTDYSEEEWDDEISDNRVEID